MSLLNSDTFRFGKFWLFQILRISDTFRFKQFSHFQILTHYILKLSDLETVRFWCFQILTLSDSNTFRFWHFQILTLSDSDTFRFWHLQLPGKEISRKHMLACQEPNAICLWFLNARNPFNSELYVPIHLLLQHSTVSPLYRTCKRRFRRSGSEVGPKKYLFRDQNVWLTLQEKPNLNDINLAEVFFPA